MLVENKRRGKKNGGRPAAKGKATKELFWVRPGHPDLDRAGNFLLKHLTEIRLESKTRGTAG